MGCLGGKDGKRRERLRASMYNRQVSNYAQMATEAMSLFCGPDTVESAE